MRQQFLNCVVSGGHRRPVGEKSLGIKGIAVEGPSLHASAQAGAVIIDAKAAVQCSPAASQV